jgi:hypothetical protein
VLVHCAFMLKGYDPTGTGGEDSLDTSIEKFVSESSFNNNVPVEESSLSIKHSTPVPSSRPFCAGHHLYICWMTF